MSNAPSSTLIAQVFTDSGAELKVLGAARAVVEYFVSDLPWQIITVQFGTESDVPRVLTPKLQALGIEAEFTVPMKLRAKTKGLPSEHPALAGYVLASLNPARAALRLKGLCDLVTGYLHTVGSDMPALIDRQVFAQFLEELKLLNEAELEAHGRLQAVARAKKLSTEAKQTVAKAGTLELNSKIVLAGGLQGTVVANGRGTSIVATTILGRMIHATIARRKGGNPRQAA